MSHFAAFARMAASARNPLTWKNWLCADECEGFSSLQRPLSGRDQGLGRAIVDARLQAARQLGWSRILVSAIRGNQDMLRIYQSLGFEFSDRYPECSDQIKVDP